MNTPKPSPTPMRIPCPDCGHLHIDDLSADGTDWATETKSERQERLPYVTLVLRRRELAELRALGRSPACEGGQAIFDQIAGNRPYVRVRWDALSAVWLAAAHPAYARWFLERFGLSVQAANANLVRANLVRANLDGADLDGAMRSQDDPAVLGFDVVDGKMKRKP